MQGLYGCYAGFTRVHPCPPRSIRLIVWICFTHSSTANVCNRRRSDVLRTVHYSPMIGMCKLRRVEISSRQESHCIGPLSPCSHCMDRCIFVGGGKMASVTLSLYIAIFTRQISEVSDYQSDQITVYQKQREMRQKRVLLIRLTKSI